MKGEHPLRAGETLTYERTFTDDDIGEFQRLSRDAGRHHVEPDAAGRRLVHGLLTATMPTKLGGDLDFLAREMSFEFLAPVLTGDRILCEMTIAEVIPRKRGTGLTLTGTCRNQDGVEVLRFRGRGIVLAVEG